MSAAPWLLNVPYGDVQLLYQLVTRGSLVDIHSVDLLLLDIEEAHCICFFFPVGSLAERTAYLNVRLNVC